MFEPQNFPRFLCSPGPKTNILIDQGGHACITDFGSTATTSDQSTFSPSCIEDDAIRWMSPELLDPGMFGLKESRPTKESDCYALGMVTFEVLSGQKPYTQCKGAALTRKVLGGERPRRPRGDEGRLLTDGVWRMLQLCWKPQPGDRINARVALRSLEGDLSPSRSSSSVDGDVEKDADDRSDVTLNGSSTFSLSSLRSQAHPRPSPWHDRSVDQALWRRTPGFAAEFPPSCDGCFWYTFSANSDPQARS